MAGQKSRLSTSIQLHLLAVTTAKESQALQQHIPHTMASSYPDKKVVRCYDGFPPQELPLSHYPDFNNKLLQFHSSIASLPQNFKGTRMASYGLAKQIFKRVGVHDEDIIKKAVEEQENTEGYESLLRLVQGSDGQQRVAASGSFSWRELGEIEGVAGKVEGLKDQVKDEVEKEEWLEEHGDAEPVWE